MAKVHGILSSRIGSNSRVISHVYIGELSAEFPTSLQLGSAEKAFNNVYEQDYRSASNPIAAPLRLISFVVATSSFLIPVAFHQLENVPFAITEKHDSKSGNDVTEIDDRIGFDAVSP